MVDDQPSAIILLAVVILPGLIWEICWLGLGVLGKGEAGEKWKKE